MKKYAYMVLTIVLAGCGSSFKTENGTVVSYIKKGNEAPSDTLVSYFLLKYEKEGDTVFFETKKDAPTPIMLDSTFLGKQGTFFEVFKSVKIGDSLTYSVSADELFVKNFNGRLPNGVESEDPILVTVSFLEQVSMKAYRKKALTLKREQMLEQVDKEQVAIDMEIIDAYLAENNIEAIKLESGLRYVITEKGEGKKIELGDNVNVNYAGYLLTGEYFDTSMEDRARANGLYNEARPYNPYPVSVYNTPVITGWHEGIYQLNVGDKATLYIPSPLGYGPRGSAPVIKPNDVLVFDIEITQ